jgi:hypothetical protein
MDNNVARLQGEFKNLIQDCHEIKAQRDKAMEEYRSSLQQELRDFRSYRASFEEKWERRERDITLNGYEYARNPGIKNKKLELLDTLDSQTTLIDLPFASDLNEESKGDQENFSSNSGASRSANNEKMDQVRQATLAKLEKLYKDLSPGTNISELE